MAHQRRRLQRVGSQDGAVGPGLRAVRAGWAGVLVYRAWHVGVTAGLVVATAAVALARWIRGTTAHQLLHPRHVREIAEVLRHADESGARVAVAKQDLLAEDIHVERTSLGVRISAHKIVETTGCSYHYALSSGPPDMTGEAAWALARLIRLLRHPSGSGELVEGKRGVFHLLIG